MDAVKVLYYYLISSLHTLSSKALMSNCVCLIGVSRVIVQGPPRSRVSTRARIGCLAGVIGRRAPPGWRPQGDHTCRASGLAGHSGTRRGGGAARFRRARTRAELQTPARAVRVD